MMKRSSARVITIDSETETERKDLSAAKHKTCRCSFQVNVSIAIGSLTFSLNSQYSLIVFINSDELACNYAIGCTVQITSDFNKVCASIAASHSIYDDSSKTGYAVQ